MCAVKRKKQCRSSFPVKLNRQLETAGQAAEKLGVDAYLVGGAVRDLLLGRKNLDWDIVVEGDPAPLVRTLGRQWHARISSHERFGTYVLTLPDGRHIDIATARKESYPRPGVLPLVTFSDLEHDLFRRDFAINALALALNGVRHGKVIDCYGGMIDLKKKVLRVLHAKSFRDDPTRIFRLARFAGRGFSIDPVTEQRAVQGKKYLRFLSDERIREELLAILDEKDPFPALHYLDTWGIAPLVLPGVNPGIAGKRLARLPRGSRRLYSLLKDLPDRDFETLLRKLQLPRAMKREIDGLRRPKKPAPALNGNDLIGMGYRPGPLFREILDELSRRRFKTRRQACRYVFDKFPQKI